MLPQPAEQSSEIAPILRREPADELVDVPRVERQELTDERASFLREPDARDAAVARLGATLDDAVALGAVDEAGHVARGDEQRTAEPGERLPVVALEAREQVEACERHLVFELASELGQHQRVAAKKAEPDAHRLV